MSWPSEVTRRSASAEETTRANRTWWDGEAADYYAEHGAFLGDRDFVWGPERLREADAHLLGDVRGRRVLEIGAGSGQCSRWLAGQGAEVVASDLSGAMLTTGAGIDRRAAGRPLSLVQCDGRALPFAEASFDVVFTAYGVIPFVADSDVVLREACRVLRPGGRFVFSTTHPIRWAFPDDPGPRGLTVTQSYFDRTPYVEQDAAGRATYVEHHPGRPGPRDQRRRPVPRRPRRARVAGRARRAVGRLVTAARAALPGDGDLRVREEVPAARVSAAPASVG